MAPALVQSPAVVGGSPASVVFGSAVVAGDIGFVVGTWGNVATAPTSGPSDTRGSTWNSSGVLNDATNAQSGIAYYTVFPSSGADTVSITYADPNFNTTGIAEFSGVDQVTPLDVAAVFKNTGQAATTAPATGSITPVTNGCLIVSVLVATSAQTLTSQPAGFTTFINDASHNVYAAYFVQTTAAAINPTWTTASGRYTSATYAFRPASAGAAPRAILTMQTRRAY